MGEALMNDIDKVEICVGRFNRIAKSNFAGMFHSRIMSKSGSVLPIPKYFNVLHCVMSASLRLFTCTPIGEFCSSDESLQWPSATSFASSLSSCAKVTAVTFTITASLLVTSLVEVISIVFIIMVSTPVL